MAREYKLNRSIKSLTKLAVIDAASLFSTSSGSAIPTDGKDLSLYSKDLTLERVAGEAKIVVLSTLGFSEIDDVNGKEAKQLKRAIETSFLKEARVPAIVLCGSDHAELQLWSFFLSNYCHAEVDHSTSFFVSAKTPSLIRFAQSIGLQDRHSTPEDIFGAKEQSHVAHNAGAANMAIIDMFKSLARLSFKVQKKGPGFTYTKVYKALASFPHPITTGNLKEVLRLHGVGPESVKHIKELITTGRVRALDSLKAQADKF